MNHHDESVDFEWIDETLQGRVRSFSNVIEKYQDRVYSLVVKSIKHPEDAKDITQNIFINAFSHLKTFRKECSFQTWLYRIAINLIKNYWRYKKNRLVITESELLVSVQTDKNRFRDISDVNEEINSEDFKQTANRMISFLPPKQRQMFVMFYAGGYTCQEIAEIFKTSPSNVKIQLHRGRQLLFKKFKNIFK